MKILKSWLNDWIDIENISNTEISEALESLGFEIENKKELNPNYENIIVGKVLEVYEHPNADKVRITKTDVGNNIYEISEQFFGDMCTKKKKKICARKIIFDHFWLFSVFEPLSTIFRRHVQER